MNVLIVDSDQRFREIIRYVLAYHFGGKGIEAVTTLPPGLAESDSVCLIMDSGQAISGARDGMRALHERLGQRLALILCGDPAANHEAVGLASALGMSVAGVIEKPNVIDPVVNLVRTLVRQPGRRGQTEEECSYLSVGQHILEVIDQTPVDIYLRAAGDKFVRLLQAGDRFDQNPLESLKKNAGGDLWIAASDAAKLTAAFQAWLAVLQKHGDEFDAAVDLPLSIEAQRMLQNMFHALGFTTEVQRAARQVIQVVLAQLRANPRIAELLAVLDQHHDSYLCAHSMILAYLSCSASRALGWDSEFTLRKLAMASIVHDLTLGRDDLARLRTIGELGRLRAAGQHHDAAVVESHPPIAAQLIRSMTDFPMGADVIVEQHHVLPDGMGLTSEIGSHKIDPLSALFIILHDFVDRAFDRGTDADLAGLLTDMEPEYRLAPFAKPFDALKDILNQR